MPLPRKTLRAEVLSRLPGLWHDKKR